MKIRTYENASDFLDRAQKWLEEEEAPNSLMLGIAFRLQRRPVLAETACLKTVEADGKLLLAVIMTPPYNMILSGRGDEAEAATPPLIEALRDKRWPVPGVLGPRELAWSFTQHWITAAGGSYRLVRRQRVHQLRQVMDHPPVQGALRLATEAEFETVLDWVNAFQKEALDGSGSEPTPEVTRERVKSRLADDVVYLWDDGGPVSMAMKIRPTRNGTSVSYVYTPPEARRRGYATACVAELSRLLLASGYAFCSLFTDLANPTSNHIYWEIGYRPAADFDAYSLQGESG